MVSAEGTAAVARGRTATDAGHRTRPRERLSERGAAEPQLPSASQVRRTRTRQCRYPYSPIHAGAIGKCLVTRKATHGEYVLDRAASAANNVLTPSSPGYHALRCGIGQQGARSAGTPRRARFLRGSSANGETGHYPGEKCTIACALNY